MRWLLDIAKNLKTFTVTTKFSIMKKLFFRLKLSFWYLKKGYFKQLFNLVFKDAKDNTRAASTQWCESISITEEEALKALKVPLKDIAKEQPELIEYANTKQEECPYKMGGPGSIKVLYSIISALSPKRIIETGVAYGWSTLAILSGSKNNRDFKLWSIDMPYPFLGNASFVGCVVHPSLRDNWKLIRKPDIKALPIAVNESQNIDFCHYDSDKTYRGRMRSYNLLWKHLNKDGYFMSDDINDNLAFKDFCNQINKTPIVFKVKEKFVGLIKK